MAAHFKQGELLDNPYLWRWQHVRGETAGRKERPVCLAIAVLKTRDTHLFLLAVTSTPPTPDRIAVPIPQIEARRGGLNDWKQGWVIVDEYNHDIAERSFHLDATRGSRGRFSEAFMDTVKGKFRDAILSGATKRIDRIEG